MAGAEAARGQRCLMQPPPRASRLGCTQQCMGGAAAKGQRCVAGSRCERPQSIQAGGQALSAGQVHLHAGSA